MTNWVGPTEEMPSGPVDDTVETAQAAFTPEHPGRYVLLSEVGRGGQSVVRVARDLHLRRDVAFKQLVAPEAGAARFVREARLTGRLEHPGIVAVHELGVRPDGSLYATQKLIRGETLAARLALCLDLEDRLRLLKHFVDVCFAVGYAHGQGVVHRDLKPENIMVGRFGETVVLDWGIARALGPGDEAATADDGPMTTAEGPPVESVGTGATAVGTVLGTPGYMAPEQARGHLDQIGPHTDVWSLGAILHEMLTGRTAIDGPSPMSRIFATVQHGIPPVRSRAPEVPKELAAIADRAVAQAPEGRFPDAVALAHEVENFRAGRRVAMYHYSTWELLARFALRHRVPALMLGLMVVLAVVAGFALRAERDRAVAALVETASEQAALFRERGRAKMREGFLNAAREDFERSNDRRAIPESVFASRMLAERLLPVSEVGGASSLRVVSVSADGERCAGSGPMDQVWIWPCAKPFGQPQALAVGAPAFRVVFSPNGQRIGVAAGGEVLIFDGSATRARRRHSVGSEARVSALAFSVDDSVLAFGDTVGLVRLLSGESTPRTLAVAGAPVTGLSFTPDGLRLLVATERGSELFTVSGDGVFAAEGRLRGDQFQWLRRGGALVGEDRQVPGGLLLWVLGGGEGRSLGRHARPLTALSAAVDGTWVASGSADGEVRLTEPESGRVFFRHDFGGPVRGLAAGDTGALRVVLRNGRTFAIDTLRAAELRPLQALDGGTSRVTALAYSPDGQRLVYGDSSGAAGVSTSPALSRVGRFLPEAPPMAGRAGVTAVAWSHDSQRAVVALPGRIFEWAKQTEARRVIDFNAADVARSLVYSRDDTRLIVGRQSGEVEVYDTRAFTRLAVGRPLGGAGLAGLAVESQVGAVYVAGLDGRVIEADLETLSVRRTLLDADGGAPALALSTDGRKMAVGRDDKTVWVVSLGEAGDNPLILRGHAEPVRFLAFVAGTDLLASLSPDQTVRIWSLDEGDAVLTVDESNVNDPSALAVSPDGRRLAIGDAVGVITVLPLPARGP